MNQALVEQALDLLKQAVELTPKQVYGEGWIGQLAPRGYVYSCTDMGEEFRPPLDGEPFLLPDGKSVGMGPHNRPRFILKRVPRRLVFDILDENRPAEEGEWYQHVEESNVYQAGYVCDVCPSRYILSAPRVEEDL